MRACVRVLAQRINASVYAREAYMWLCASHAPHTRRVRRCFAQAHIPPHTRTSQGRQLPLARARSRLGIPRRACKDIGRVRHAMDACARARFRAYTQVHECVSSQARCRESERQAPTARDVRGAMRGAQRSRQRTCPMGARHTDLARPGTCTRTRATHTCCCSQFGRVRVLFATGPALARRRQHHRRRRHCRHRRRLWISRYGARVVRPPPAAAPTRAYASTPLATPCEGTKSHQRLDLHLPNEF
jgi:hypothetical protein